MKWERLILWKAQIWKAARKADLYLLNPLVFAESGDMLCCEMY